MPTIAVNSTELFYERIGTGPPLLLIHGGADTILSHESSQALYDRAGEPKTIRILPGVGHGLAAAFWRSLPVSIRPIW